MKKKLFEIIIFTFLSVLFLQACTSINDQLKGKIANPDQIIIISNTDMLRVWETKDLSLNYSLISSLPDNLNLTGYISISKHITNTYAKIKRLILQISFLDNDGKVISTSNIHPAYSVNSTPPKKIKFNSNVSLPASAVAFCFSYSGEFSGDKRSRESLYINQNPFH